MYFNIFVRVNLEISSPKQTRDVSKGHHIHILIYIHRFVYPLRIPRDLISSHLSPSKQIGPKGISHSLLFVNLQTNNQLSLTFRMLIEMA